MFEEITQFFKLHPVNQFDLKKQVENIKKYNEGMENQIHNCIQTLNAKFRSCTKQKSNLLRTF